MPSYSIGEAARLCGLTASAIRYYEQAGLAPRPMRVSRQRRYTPEGIGRLRLVQIAREAGFTIAEIRAFVAGFPAGTPPARRWQELAQRKRAQVEEQMARLRNMRRLLATGFQCSCACLEDCARVLAHSR